MSTISDEARELLAAEYDEQKKPWFSKSIRDKTTRAYDAPLIVITNLLALRRANSE